MRPGSRVRKVGTRHMLLQFAAVGVLIATFTIRWSDRHNARSSVVWIVLDAIGVLMVTVTADLGGQMVFKMARWPDGVQDGLPGRSRTRVGHLAAASYPA